MIFGNQRLVVSLLPGRLCAAWWRSGQVIREEVVFLDGIDWENAWREGLMPFDSALRQLLSRFKNGRRVPVSVLYSSSAANVNCYQIKGEKRDARAAVLAKLNDGDTSGVMHSVEVISATGRSEKEWSVLAISEREEIMNKVYAWVARCGGQLSSVLPLQGAVALAAAESALSSDESRAYCMVGQEWSAVACGNKDGLQLVRVFELGYRAMASVYQRVEDGSTHASIEKRLLELGLPYHNTEIDPELRTTLLAQLSPIVQRFCVEVKQTLRFGISAELMPSELYLAGRGALIPEFARAVAEGVDLHAKVSPRMELEPNSGVFASGTTHRWFADHHGCGSVLRPTPMLVQKSAGRLRVATVCGFVLGALAVAGEYGYIKAKQAELKPEFEAISGQVAQIVRERDTLNVAQELAHTAGVCSLVVDDARAKYLPVGVVMEMLSENTRDSARLENIELRMNQSTIEMRLKALVVGETDESAGAAYREFVNSFESNDFVNGIEMGAVDLESPFQGKFTRRFTMVIRLDEQVPGYKTLAEYVRVGEDDL
ncbi:MAG: hypothetical protein AB8F26_01525 [Phycisphaerales bacterium]